MTLPHVLPSSKRKNPPYLHLLLVPPLSLSCNFHSLLPIAFDRIMEQTSGPAQPAGRSDCNSINVGHEQPPARPITPPFLPNDIMRMIVESLRLPIYGLPHTLLEHEFREKRETLRNLCLTARFLNTYARPLLYETVIFFRVHTRDPKSPLASLEPTIFLIRTLLLKPDTCGFIKNMICPAGFGEEWFKPNPKRYSTLDE
ncbi:hypothetical protein F5Y05DRAFT_236079 [Hypoxylon sp. FL0543]|nr:hypothetical protein F5Y05DRAFT_236079 [Hypoxylon sp. FL0543]